MDSVPNIPENVCVFYAGRAMPRGVRNNNPGNIRTGDNWQGLCDIQDDRSFCQFGEIQYGIRALAYILRVSYFQRRKLRTVRDIINRWAPTSENDTAAYSAHVAKLMRVDIDESLDLLNDNKLGDMVAAIITHENGAQPYSGLQIISGIRLV